VATDGALGNGTLGRLGHNLPQVRREVQKDYAGRTASRTHKVHAGNRATAIQGLCVRLSNGPSAL
jgi:hypothetical protein